MKKLKPIKELLNTLREGCDQDKLFLIDTAEEIMRTSERVRKTMDAKRYEELRRSLNDAVFYLLFSIDEESDIPMLVTHDNN